MTAYRERVAVVTGATRGAGLGIAVALGQLGFTVYVTGRGSRSKPSPSGRPGTVEDVAETISGLGGVGYACVCDHTNDANVDALFARVAQAHGRLDVLVNNAWGGNEQGMTSQPFWELSPPLQWKANFTSGVRCAVVASGHAARLMIPKRRGLIVNTTYFDRNRFSTNLFYDLAMNANNRLAWGAALELKPHGVACVALSPGLVRTEQVLAQHRVDEMSWSSVPALQGSESTAYIGRAVVALAKDENVLARTGQVLLVGQLAREYGFTDSDGTQPVPYQAPAGTRGA